MRTTFSKFSHRNLPSTRSPKIHRKVFAVMLLVLVFGGTGFQARAQSGMWRLTIEDGTIEGSVVASNDQIVYFFDRQGQLFRFPPEEVSNARQTGKTFESLAEPRIRRQLGRRLGSDYAISPTSHYVVAHPEGRGSDWPERFENVYRSVLGYFTVRGFQCGDPPWPLQAIVCSNASDFARVAATEGLEGTRGLAGLYLLTSNRVVLFDQSGGVSRFGRQQTDQTIVHEAIHQVSFNIGVHNRCVDNPTWVVEGIATMLEIIPSDRLWNLGNHSMRHPDQLAVFQAVPERHRGNLLKHLVHSDQLFREHPRVAYALSWGMAVYLAETQTSKFSEYLQVVGSHSPTEKMTAEMRRDDFVQFFGDDWAMLAARVSRYVAEL